MPVDPKGTEPGLAPAAQTRTKVNFKCRRPDCDCIEAYDESLPSLPHKRYVCCKCGNVYTINPGGSFNVF